MRIRRLRAMKDALGVKAVWCEIQTTVTKRQANSMDQIPGDTEWTARATKNQRDGQESPSNTATKITRGDHLFKVGG